MYLYLYDNFLNSKKFNKALIRIETRLTDLGIGGKISRLSPLKNLKDLIRDEVGGGVKTVIAVGNDKTVIQVINEIVNYDVVFGIIPIGPTNKIAAALGVPWAEAACDVISARTLQKLDLGKANNIYFLSEITIPSGKATLSCDHKFYITPINSSYKINICNFRPDFFNENPRANLFNPKDGFLEALVYPASLTSTFAKNIFFNFKTKKQNSIIPFKNLLISGSSSMTILTDGCRVLKPPVKIEVVPRKLKIIVGKNRVF